jgi:hypothetical protein
VAWTRRCPGCDEVIEYAIEHNRDLAGKRATVCRKCAAIAGNANSEYKRTGRIPGFQHSSETKIKMSQKATGKLKSKEAILNMRFAQNQPATKRQIHSAATRTKKMQAGLSPDAPDWTEVDHGFVTPCHDWWNPSAPYVNRWVEVYGPISRRSGYLLHHLCENRRCVRINHLIPVTYKEHKRLHGPSQKKYACKMCKMVTTPGPLSYHQQKSGHTGRVLQ